MKSRNYKQPAKKRSKPAPQGYAPSPTQARSATASEQRRTARKLP